MMNFLQDENSFVGTIDGVVTATDNEFCTSMMQMHSNHAFQQIGPQQQLRQQLELEQQQHHGMVMYMDGFRFSLFGKNPCINLYFPGWTLDTRAKFCWAMMGVVLLGVATEAISKLRSRVNKHFSGYRKRWTITLLHALQAFVGYILMLATMTFSVELFSCVILGLCLGFALFYDDDEQHVPNNPCCNFIQDEFNERESFQRRRNVSTEDERNNDVSSATDLQPDEAVESTTDHGNETNL